MYGYEGEAGIWVRSLDNGRRKASCSPGSGQFSSLAVGNSFCGVGDEGDIVSKSTQPLKVQS